jgi:hypothetical protein
VENPTSGWSIDILGFKVMGQETEINFMESYFDIPKNMISALADDLKNMKTDDISWIDTHHNQRRSIIQSLPR